MHSLKKIFSASVVSVVLAGCASTSNDSPATYPELKLLSNQTYVWDKNISEALNVARMAQPAGPGAGMKDYEDGKKATTGRIGSGTRLFDAGLGLLGMGVMGVVSMESMNSKVNELADWKPTGVFLVEPSKIKTGDKFDFVKTRTYVSDKIIEALKTELPDFQLIGVYTSKFHAKTMGDSIIIFRSRECQKSEVFDSSENKYDGPKTLGVVNGFIEGPVDLTDFCAVEFKTNLTQQTSKGEVVVTTEFFGNKTASIYFVPLIAKGLNGYMLLPDYYEYHTRDKFGVKKAVGSEYAKVIKFGEELRFEKLK